MSPARRPAVTERLSERLADDLDDAFEDLVSAHQDALFAFVVSLGRDRGRAEEVVQDAFLRAYRALRSYPPPRIRALALRPWLHRIALNVFRNSLRRRKPELVLVEDLPPVADPEPGPEAEALRQVEQDRLLGALATLPVSYRSSVVLRYVNDLSYAEIADALAQPIGTVKSNVHRGTEMLRAALLKEAS
jgi:RNA polymerase sigma factor (sigma-70 family)